jgi:hypothetical protein
LGENNSYKGLVSIDWMKNKFNISYSTAFRLITKLGLKNATTRDISIIKNYLNGMSAKDISKNYNMTDTNVRRILNRRNVEIRHARYSADFNYFNEIDTEDKAYFLGFIYADGNVYENQMNILISIVDEDLLLKIKKYIKSNNPISYSNKKDYKGIFANAKPTCKVTIANNNIIKGLSKHEVMPNKTFKLTFPETIQNDLVKHFIRGYLDGDGSFCCYKAKYKVHQKCGLREYINTKYCIDICGTIDLLEGIRTVIKKELNIDCVKNLQQRHKERDNNNRTLKISGKNNVLNILDWLYKDATVYLDRKYNKYLQILR